jgi:RHS repeat-associated protein
VTYDNRTGGGYGYSYDAAGRMVSFSINGVVQAEYAYNWRGQQSIRRLPQTGQEIYMLYGPDGNRIAEIDATTKTVIREYIWLDGRPLAVLEGGAVYYIRADHIGRPVFATDGAGTKVWEVSYLPFGGVHVSSGLPVDARFPGQWYQAESGLHQNWMRDYDPTTGRYIEPDPLGLVDGPSVYGYVGGNPGRYIDPRGEQEVPMDLGLSRPFSPQLTGAGSFFENYAKMREANWKQSDKYFHCMANCEATMCPQNEDSLLSGYGTSVLFSLLREVTDTVRKFQSFEDWRADEHANSIGRNGAINAPEESCKSICGQFRPRGLPARY